MVLEAEDFIERNNMDTPNMSEENNDVGNNNHEMTDNGGAAAAAANHDDQLQEIMETFAAIDNERQQLDTILQQGLLPANINVEAFQNLNLQPDDAEMEEENTGMFDAEFNELNSQLDNIDALLNQLEGKSDQLFSNLQALLQDIRQ